MHAPFAPLPSIALPISHTVSLADGANVLALLNSSEAYNEEIHGDDLVTTSANYRSHRHDVDRLHSLAEQQKKWQQEQHQRVPRQHLQQERLSDLLAAEDIVAYLANQRYVDDVYGLPAPFEELIKQARQEAASSSNDTPRKAVQRLQMIRQHLMDQSHGNPTAAATAAYELEVSDWSHFFFSVKKL